MCLYCINNTYIYIHIYYVICTWICVFENTHVYVCTMHCHVNIGRLHKDLSGSCVVPPGPSSLEARMRTYAGGTPTFRKIFSIKVAPSRTFRDPTFLKKSIVNIWKCPLTCCLYQPNLAKKSTCPDCTAKWSSPPRMRLPRLRPRMKPGFQDLSKIFPRSFPIKAEATNQVTAEPDQNRSAMQAMRLLGSQLGITALHRSLSVRDELQQFIQAWGLAHRRAPAHQETS